MSNINKAAVLNPFSDLTANILNYVPRATTSEFGIVAIGSGINVDELGRIYLDTQEYSDRLTAIEAQAASTLTTQKSEVAAAIAQVNLTQSQTISDLTTEVNTLKTDLTNTITNTRNDLIAHADQLAQDVTDITQQLSQDKATFTQEIQDAMNYLKDEASVASALRTARTFTWTGDATGSLTFNGTSNVTTPLVLANSGVAAGTYKSVTVDAKGRVIAGSEVTPGMVTATTNTGAANVATTNTNTFLNITEKVGSNTATVKTSTQITGTGSVSVSSDATGKLTIAGSQSITGNAATATKLASARTINGVLFDGTANIEAPANRYVISKDQRDLKPAGLDARSFGFYFTSLGGMTSTSDSVYGDLITLNSYSDLSGGKQNALFFRKNTMQILHYQGDTYGATTWGTPKTLAYTDSNISGNAATATKLQTSRTISLTGGVTGSVNFDGSANAPIATTITGLGVANGIATLDSSGQVPSTQLPSYVDDVLEYLNVAAFPTTGVAGKIYVETTGNTTYRWSGTGYVKITSGEVSSVAGKTGVVTLTKSDVGLSNVDDTADSTKNVASAAKLATARTIGGVSFDGTTNINLPGVNTAGNQSTSGNAGSATKLATARTITVGLAGKTFDGTTDVAYTVNEVLPTATSGQFLKFDGTNWIAAADNNTTYSTMSQAEATTGTATQDRLISASVLKSAIQTHAPVQTSITGNAATSTRLATARTINGVAFDGTANITVADSTKLPLSGGTITGNIMVSGETYHKGIQYLTKSRWESYTSRRVFGTTYLNNTPYEKEVNVKSAIGTSVLLSLKVTFTDLVTNESIFVYFGCSSNWSGGIYCAECFTVPPYTSYKAEVIRSDTPTSIVILNVLEWWERDYVA